MHAGAIEFNIANKLILGSLLGGVGFLGGDIHRMFVEGKASLDSMFSRLEASLLEIRKSYGSS